MKLKMMKPEAISEEEMNREIAERRARKCNVSVNYLVEKGMKTEEVVKKIREKTGIRIREDMVDNKWKSGFRVIFMTREEREFALQKKSELKGEDIWLERDATDREKRVHRWIREYARQVNDKCGKLEARASYAKMWRYGEWWRYNERTAKMEREQLFRRGSF